MVRPMISTKEGAWLSLERERMGDTRRASQRRQCPNCIFICLNT